MDVSSAELEDGSTVHLGLQIGQGSFGIVRRGEIKPGNKTVAVKLELKSKRRRYLYKEGRILEELQGLVGIPITYGFTSTESHNLLVMELLGESLNEKFKKCGRELSIKSVLMLFISILEVMEGVHHKRYIHRDIKPHNFLTSMAPSSPVIYLIDFGLSRKAADTVVTQGNNRGRKGIVGTLPFVSVNMHLGAQASYRDDLEAVGFMLIYLAKGTLPWYDPKKSKLKEDEIKVLKQESRFNKLCSGLPDEVGNYMSFVRAMTYDAIPDYFSLRNYFQSAVSALDWVCDFVYDWMLLDSQDTEVVRKYSSEGSHAASKLLSTKRTPYAGIKSGHLSTIKESQELKASGESFGVIVHQHSGESSQTDLRRKSSDPTSNKKTKKKKKRHVIPPDTGLPEVLLNEECLSTSVVVASKHKLVLPQKTETPPASACTLF